MEILQEKKPIVKSLKSLGLFESVTFPIERTWTVRHIITNICLTSDARYKTTTSREDGIVTVIRIK
jgi:hypothetical protein